jgi:hypothetical protein
MTWKLRVGMLVVVVLAAVLTRGYWMAAIAGSLVCTQAVAPSDLILVENFDPSYLIFERAAELARAGFAPRALVPVQASPDPAIANPVSKGIADVMARQARMATWYAVPIRETEPITLNAAYQIREQLTRERVSSVIVVTPGFRSRRAALVYRTVLEDLGTHVSCVPVFGPATPERWTETWHGLKEVAEEFLKLQYYRFYVIPFMARSTA